MTKNKNHIEIAAIPLRQMTSKVVLVTGIPFVTLDRIVKFTSRQPSNLDPFSEDFQPHRESSEDYYQRLRNSDRLKNIKYFILREINRKFEGKEDGLGIFPTALILAVDEMESCYSIPDFEARTEEMAKADKFEYESEQELKFGAYWDSTGSKLYIPNTKKRIALIVDGQHRMAGMRMLLNEAKAGEVKLKGRQQLRKAYPLLSPQIIIDEIEKFEFICTVLMNFDLWEQGQIFADVNFNQKPVNKSLYYDIFGAYPNPNKNEIHLAHHLALHLNNSSKSVLKGRIKMLGTGEGLFSQAFFVEAVERLFKPNQIWGDIPGDYMKNGTQHRFLPKFFRAYFSAIRNTFSDYWPKEDETTSHRYKHILCKTTGMGALITLMEPVYGWLISNDSNPKELSEVELEKRLTSLFEDISPNGAEYFAKESNFATGAGSGLQTKLFQKIKKDLRF